MPVTAAPFESRMRPCWVSCNGTASAIDAVKRKRLRSRGLMAMVRGWCLGVVKGWVFLIGWGGECQFGLGRIGLTSIRSSPTLPYTSVSNSTGMVTTYRNIYKITGIRNLTGLSIII